MPKESGKYNVSISYDEGGVIDGDLNPVNLNVVNGVIQVTEKSTVIGTGTCGKEVTWSLGDDGTLTISGTGDMKNYTYKSEMPWYKYISEIKSYDSKRNHICWGICI